MALLEFQNNIQLIFDCLLLWYNKINKVYKFYFLFNRITLNRKNYTITEKKLNALRTDFNSLIKTEQQDLQNILEVLKQTKELY